MNDITIFNHLGNDIRVMTDEQGEPWFVGKDICDALGYANSRLTISRHLDEDDVSKRYVTDEVGARAGDYTHQRVRPVLTDHV